MDCPACHHPNADSTRFCAKCGALIPTPSTDAADPLIGQIVGGRYRIIRVLGEGGMGKVYLAEQQMGTNVRKVAVKTLQTQYANDAQVLARFHRECGTVSELEHPNTIQFFDFGQTPDGQLYIAMEYVQGQSLAAVLEQQGPMAADRLLRIFAQVCGSLEEAHNRGVVHRDLKPDNVVLSVRAGQPDFVKVLDFGIAKRSEARDQAQEQKLTQQGMVLGTPPYMSPEQFTGKELDPRSDIYSLGVMAYELVVGRLPFHADTPWEWATQHMTAQPYPFETTPVGANVPPTMRAAILRSLSKNRDDRQSSVRQFYEELAGAGQPGVAAAPAVASPSAARTGTAAMPAPLGFAGAGAGAGTGTAAFVPAVSTGTAATPVAYTPPAQPAYPEPVMPQPAAPSAPRPRGGSKGLVVGLAAGAGVLGIVGLVLLLGKGGTGQAEPPALVLTATPTPATAVPPPDTVAPPNTSVAMIPTVEQPGNLIAPPPPAGGKPTPGGTKPQGSAAGAHSGAAEPPATSEQACNNLKSVAVGKAKATGSATTAAQHFKQCTDKSVANDQARSAIANKAKDDFNNYYNTQDCKGADVLIRTVQSIGVDMSAERTRLDQRRAAKDCK